MKSIELSDNHRGAVGAGALKGGQQLWPALERIGPLARLNLFEDSLDVEPFSRCETRDGLALGIKAEVAAIL